MISGLLVIGAGVLALLSGVGWQALITRLAAQAIAKVNIKLVVKLGIKPAALNPLAGWHGK